MAAGGTLGQGSTSIGFGDEHPGQQDLPPSTVMLPGYSQDPSLHLDPQKGAVSGPKALCGDVSPLVSQAGVPFEQQESVGHTVRLYRQ